MNGDGDCVHTDSNNNEKKYRKLKTNLSHNLFQDSVDGSVSIDNCVSANFRSIHLYFNNLICFANYVCVLI